MEAHVLQPEAPVGRHDVAKAQADGVARHEVTRLGIDPLAVALHPGLDRERRFQGGDGVARLMFFPESDQGVGEKQNEDDAEVRPVADPRAALVWGYALSWFLVTAYRVLDGTKDNAPKRLGEAEPDVKADSAKADVTEPDATKTAAAMAS
jgi:hypothetical protein